MSFEKDYLEDDQSQEPKEDIFLSGYEIEFIDEHFYCNKGKIELSEVIDIIDMIDNLDGHYKAGIAPLYIYIFNMYVSMTIFRQVYVEFYDRGELN